VLAGEEEEPVEAEELVLGESEEAEEAEEAEESEEAEVEVEAEELEEVKNHVYLCLLTLRL